MTFRRFLTYFLPVAVAVVVFSLWTYVHFALTPDNRFLLPPPNAVFEAWIANRADLLHAAWNTSLGAGLGFLLAVVVSIVFAIALGSSPLVRISFYPYLMILQMTPIIVFAPMFVLWLGPGLKSVTAITFLISFFPLATNTTQGLLSTDRNLVELFRMYRAGWWQQLWHLRIPSAMPYFFTGLRIAATLAPIGALVGDYTAGTNAGGGGGLGFQTIIFSSQIKIPALFATAAVTCVIGFVFVSAVVALSWLCLHKWHDSYERPDN